jgi:hypothetical protein
MFQRMQQGVQAWEEAVARVLGSVEEQLNAIGTPLRIWVSSKMAQLVEATPPGDVISTGTATREEVMMISALFQSMLQWMQTPIEAYRDANGDAVLMTPGDIVSYRRMPAAPGEEVLGAPMGVSMIAPEQIKASLPLSGEGKNGWPKE